MSTRLDISIGPVQGFVAESRRTRDLWGSSYLLAFLAAHAMCGAQRAGGRIVRPFVDQDPLYRWVFGTTGNTPGEPPEPPPRIGSLPNHFVVEPDDGGARQVADAARAALDAAWKCVCAAVWDRFVEHACAAGSATAEIWERQVRSFWEVSWTAGGDHERGLLARRKHWRSRCPPAEPGDKCTVMHDFQELSGYVRPRDGAQQDQFWQRFRTRLGPLDLRDDERLCAVAVVKRLFPKVDQAALGWPVEASHWPSTAYVGAVPWLRRAVEQAPEQARTYAEAVRCSAPDDASATPHPPFRGLDGQIAGGLCRLDANYLHHAFVASERLCPLPEEASSDVRRQLGERLRCLYEARDPNGRRLGAPPVFYALLLADGDRLGHLVENVGGKVVSKALAAFTRQAPKIVAKHDGVTVYAGGDDLLAMLPSPDALRCADAVASKYRALFADTAASHQATLSAAVVFAHVRLPLQAVLAEARRLLDRVAKDGNGRDSVAAAVLKPGALHCQWVSTWTRPGAPGTSATGLIDSLVEELRRGASEPGLSSALLYRLRATLSALCGWERWRPGDWGEVPAGLDLRPFLRAEIHHSLDVRMDGDAPARAAELTERVCAVLDRSHATDGGGSRAGLDALLLARFLADPGQQESER